jgi:hypothetical protein
VNAGAIVTIDVKKEGTNAEMKAKHPHIAVIANAG